MVTNIIDGISVRLNETFGGDYTIYSETVKQGFKEPCFFVFALNPSQIPMIGRRYRRQHPVDVHYFPVRKFDKNADMLEVADQLYEALEYISVDGNLVRGTDMHYEIVDDVLHFFVEYNVFVVKKEQKTPMEEMQEHVNVKE